MLEVPVWMICARGLDEVADLDRAGEAHVADVGRDAVGAAPARSRRVASLVDPLEHASAADGAGVARVGGTRQEAQGDLAGTTRHTGSSVRRQAWSERRSLLASRQATTSRWRAGHSRAHANRGRVVMPIAGPGRRAARRQCCQAPSRTGPMPPGSAGIGSRARDCRGRGSCDLPARDGPAEVTVSGSPGPEHQPGAVTSQRGKEAAEGGVGACRVGDGPDEAAGVSNEV